MTLSILGRCERTGMLGMAIASSSIAVASRCAFAQAGVGVVASQNVTDPGLGPAGLALLGEGLDAKTALATLLAQTKHAEYRQIAILDADGQSGQFSGDKALGCHATANGENCVAAGNMLGNEMVCRAMVDSFAGSRSTLPGRLLSALEAGLVAGGEAGPVHSAGLKIAHVQPWPYIDLRVDWLDLGPVAELRALWQRYEPQAEDYTARALDPASAPSYGVPGDE